MISESRATSSPASFAVSQNGLARPKVFLVCSGLGHLRRGFESFTQECFDALVDEPALDLTLFAGGGKTRGRQIALWTLHRQEALTQWLGSVSGRGVYFIEQATFFLSLIPHLLLKKPNIVFFMDGNLGNMLWHWRRWTGASYKLLFSNGGPLMPPFPRSDKVQQVNPYHLQQALHAGDTAEKNVLVPYGFQISPQFTELSLSEKQALRKEVRLPTDRKIVLSVGAINSSHKRMDYLVREFAKLAEPRPFLLMLGQLDEESPAIVQLATQLLGEENFSIRSATYNEMSSYYQVADIFILTSISEAFGRVLAEAASYGLICIAHDYEVSRYVLDAEGCFCDMKIEGTLAQTLTELLLSGRYQQNSARRHQAIYDKFSWDVLRPRYVELIQQCAAA